MNIGTRLREERERLGLSQEALGATGGVKKLAQFNYEKGDRQPDAAYLAAVAAVGVDVLYVLTGQRSNAPLTAHLPPANPREAALLDNYRNSPEAGKDAIERTAFALAKSNEQLKKTG